MSVDNLFPMTSISAGDGLSPSDFKAYQLKDYLDFRASWATGNVSVLRLYANADVHVYGELVLHDGGLRSFNTVGLTTLDSSQDIVSFRTGTGAGDEVLRIENDGTLSSAPETTLSLRSRVLATAPIRTAFTLNTDVAIDSTQTYLELQQAGSTAVTLTGAISGTGALRAWHTGGLTITAEATGSVYKDLTLEGQTLRLSTKGASAIEQWTKLEIASNVRVMNIEDSGATLKDLDVRAATIKLSTMGASSVERWGVFDISSNVRRLTISNSSSTSQEFEINAEKLRFKDGGAATIWGELYVSTKSYLATTNDLYLQAASGGTGKDTYIEGANLKFLGKNTGSKIVVTAADLTTERAGLSNAAKLTLTAGSSVEPTVALDATGTTSGKNWEVRSGTTGSGLGRLLLVNTTDSKTVELDTDGSVRTPGFLVFTSPYTTTTEPANSDGSQYAVAIQTGTSKERIWVKLGTGGNGSWWYVSLTQRSP